MADVFLRSPAQMKRIKPFFPLSRGVPRVDDRRVVSGIVFVIRNGLRWRDAPPAYGPQKTLYNRIFAGLSGQAGAPDRLMIYSTYLKAHRTTANLLKKGCSPLYRAHQGRRPDDRCPATRARTAGQSGLRQ
jgi:putative transposase